MGFEIFNARKGWRGRIEIFSKTGKSKELKDRENFSADVNLPLDNFNTTPDKIKEEIFSKFLKALEEIIEQLKKKEFTEKH